MTTHLSQHERTLPTMMRLGADATPDKTLVVFDTVTWSYRETVAVAERSAHRLATDFGLKRGDSIALLVRNRPEFLEIVLGAAWLGVISAPLNVAAKGEQLRHMLSNSDARIVFAEPDLVDRVVEAAEQGPNIIVVADEGEQIPSGATRWQLPDESRTHEPAPVEPGDPFAILYTSGTTGVSKGVLCSHAQYYWWAVHNINLLELTSDDVLLTTLPLFHTNALSAFVQALRAGGTIAYKPRFSASGFKRSLVETGATVTYLLGAMVPILLTVDAESDDADTALDRVLAPGVPDDAAQAFIDRYDIKIIDGFASTESNFVIGSRPHERRSGWMGLLQEGFQARVADEYDAEVPDGTPGELLLRSDDPYAFSLGYHKMPEATVAAWRNLWLHTGDRVVRDADGYYKFLDRIKDVIRRRGENISSFEVEEALLRHPAVSSAAVYPVASDLAEDEVMVSIVLAPGASLTAPELLDHAQQYLAYYAVPRYVDFVTELPLTENGKVRKFMLRERGVTDATWDREAEGYVLRRDG